MSNPLTLLGDSLKALASSPHLTFTPTTSAGYAPASFWPGSLTTSTRKDFGALVGDPLQNYVIAAAVNAVSLALPDAPPYLENLRDGRWVRVDVHPVLDFLRQPHTDLDDADVWSLTSLYRLTRGEAFWIIHLSDAGQPTEAVPYDPRRVRVIGTRDELIAGYEVTTEDGRLIPFPKSQVLHFRHLPDPNNPRRGWTPLSTGTRHLVGSNAASTYHTALLLNGAVSSWLISLRDSGQNNVTPEQFQTFLDAMRRKYAGTTETAGGIDGLSIPLDIHRMAYSPDEMAIDKLVGYYEQTLCSLTGVSKKLLDLGADATYLNLREAITDFWERRLVPMRNKDARALTNQLLPLFGLEPTQWRVAFDFSNVPALQENQDALFTRWRDLFKAGGCDLYTLQTKIGLPDVPDEYKERFYGDGAKDAEESSPTLEAKFWRNFAKSVIDKNGLSHDASNGRFDGGRGSESSPAAPSPSSLNFWGGDGRDEATRQHFNGDLSVTGHDSPEVKNLCQTFFGQTLSADDWKQLAGAPDKHDVRVKAKGSRVEVRIDKGKFFDQFVISRIEPSDGDITQSSSFLELEALFTNKNNAPKGLAPRMLAYIFAKCEQLGIDTISLDAAGYKGHSKKYTGYSRWPQLGFDADLLEEEEKELPPYLAGGKTVGDILDKGGFDWWVENGTGRRMDFDLRPNSRSRKVFDTYLSDKGIRIR